MNARAMPLRGTQGSNPFASDSPSESASAWPWPVESPPVGSLADDEVQVWWASFRQAGDRVGELARLLSADEAARAARFRFPEHRDRFIVGRGLLRELLGAYLGRPATALRFEEGARGKPELAGAEGGGLCFNLSHSGDGVLYAVASRKVGADLECHDRATDYAAIIERVCTRRELASFREWPAERRRQAFFDCWTRKEAVAKASGDGLAGGLQNLEVCFRGGLLPDSRLCLQDVENREWSVLTLPLGAGWSGALAAAGADWRWRGWRWRDALGPTG